MAGGDAIVNASSAAAVNQGLLALARATDWRVALAGLIDRSVGRTLAPEWSPADSALAAPHTLNRSSSAASSVAGAAPPLDLP